LPFRGGNHHRLRRHKHKQQHKQPASTVLNIESRFRGQAEKRQKENPKPRFTSGDDNSLASFRLYAAHSIHFSGAQFKSFPGAPIASDVGPLLRAVYLAGSSSTMSDHEEEAIEFLVIRNDEERRLHDALRHGLPLHAIREIVRADPAAIRRTEDDGSLPLHVAAEHGASSEVVRFLVDQCPHALEEKKEYGWLPLHVAARCHASFNVVRILATRCPMPSKNRTTRESFRCTPRSDMAHP
jgi:Ankyrin repeats (3 copies)